VLILPATTSSSQVRSQLNRGQTRLAACSAFTLCDRCTIDINDGSHAAYRIEYPPPNAGTHLGPPADATTIPVRFTQDDDTEVRRSPESGTDNPLETFHGVARFEWHGRTPTPEQRSAAALLVRHALQTIALQRSTQTANVAIRKAEHLAIALRTSRRIGEAIGVLMGVHKITSDQAFELLSHASQQSNRKLRDVALDVLQTGWLEPYLVKPVTDTTGNWPVGTASSPPLSSPRPAW
jgi:ANTAR domain